MTQDKISLDAIAQFQPVMSDAPLFHKSKHIQYWLRCLRTPLPNQYTSMDSNRMLLAYFTVSALDLLGVLFTATKIEERDDYINWIYRCQHNDGGFRAFPGTDFGDRTTDQNKVWDPANLPATYFALAALCILGDDLSQVQRAKTLRWLRRLQRPNGSFGELLGEHDKIEGGTDTRFSYCATGVRWILRQDVQGEVEGVPDVNIDRLEACIRELQSYDGGISEQPHHEAHAGFTYCALSALNAAHCLPPPTSSDQFTSSLRNWLVHRLTTTIDEEFDDQATETSQSLSDTDLTSTPDTSFSAPSPPLGIDPPSTTLPSLFALPTVRWAGFAGRPNKPADTCYAWWVAGSLAQLHAVDHAGGAPLRRYLLAKTQHRAAGGFGKMPGDPPDVYHSYLGLAALCVVGVGEGDEAVLGPPSVEDILITDVAKYQGLDVARKLDHEEGVLRKIDPVLCMSVRARQWRARGTVWSDAEAG